MYILKFRYYILDYILRNLHMNEYLHLFIEKITLKNLCI